MADMNELQRLALLQSNDPTPTGIMDYWRDRDVTRQDLSGMDPLSSSPRQDLAINASKAALYASIARMLADAPGPLKALSIPPAFLGADSGVSAYRNYQQTQGAHPMQMRESAWRQLLQAAQQMTQQSPFNRGGGTY